MHQNATVAFYIYYRYAYPHIMAPFAITYYPIRRRTYDCCWQRIIITRPIDSIPELSGVIRLREVWVNGKYDVLVDRLDWQYIQY